MNCSVGVVRVLPGDVIREAQVLRLADVRMLEAKRRGSGIVDDGADDDEALGRRKRAGPRRPAGDSDLRGR